MLTQEQVIAIAVEFSRDESVVEKYFDELYEYYLDSGAMPYGVAKARTGDPYEWIAAQLTQGNV